MLITLLILKKYFMQYLDISGTIHETGSKLPAHGVEEETPSGFQSLL